MPWAPGERSLFAEVEHVRVFCNELDTNAQKALADATKLIAKESRAYAIRQQPSAQ